MRVKAGKEPWNRRRNLKSLLEIAKRKKKEGGRSTKCLMILCPRVGEKCWCTTIVRRRKKNIHD